MLLACMSCGQQKVFTASATIDRQTQSDSTGVSRAECLTETAEVATLISRAETALETTCTIEKEVLSAPDSLGRQYVVERMTVNINTQEKSAGQSVEHTQKEQQTVSTAVGSSHVSVTSHTREDIQLEDKKGIPLWRKILAISTVCLVLTAIILRKQIYRLWK